ncbi:MAG: methicillin resistance protein [uncultured bacterium]|nr:MAG: methicillin resistance protein [uncultured bacterium]
MQEEKTTIESGQKNFQTEDFLQSSHWRKFQESAGKRVFEIKDDHFSAGLIEHTLPIVGRYLYVPRGPIFPNFKSQNTNSNQNSDDKNKVSSGIREIVALAKRENAGWIRIEPTGDEFLDLIKNSIQEKVLRAPHDMQPKEIFVIDIKKTPEQLLGEMKAKTRYNIGLAKKKGVKIIASSEKTEKEKHLEVFLALTNEMAQRQGIATHGEIYYRKMIESFPVEMLKIYVAEYEGKIIAANLVLFYGKHATYLHGASGNNHRNVMAPFLLQWQAILDAKERGCKTYDFGGVQTPSAKHQKHSDLVGVTKFKLGFSPLTKPIEFPGSYDIVINPRAHALYRGLQIAKSFALRLRR